MVRTAGFGRDSSGFTLIELLVVMVVVGILATIALSAFLNQRQKGWDAAVESDLRNAATVQHSILAESANTGFATTVDELAALGLRLSDGRNYFTGTPALTVSASGGATYCMTARSGSGRYFAISSERGLLSSAALLDPDTCW